jgi:hypothetical protein
MIIVRIAIIVTPRGLLTSCANYELINCYE